MTEKTTQPEEKPKEETPEKKEGLKESRRIKAENLEWMKTQDGKIFLIGQMAPLLPAKGINPKTEMSGRVVIGEVSNEITELIEHNGKGRPFLTLK